MFINTVSPFQIYVEQCQNQNAILKTKINYFIYSREPDWNLSLFLPTSNYSRFSISGRAGEPPPLIRLLIRRVVMEPHLGISYFVSGYQPFTGWTQTKCWGSLKNSIRSTASREPTRTVHCPTALPGPQHLIYTNVVTHRQINETVSTRRDLRHIKHISSHFVRPTPEANT